jgi:hypothetical protein
MRDADDKSRANLYSKYLALFKTVERLEPSTITMMYKEYNNASTFYPHIGIFFNEFALVYCSNLHLNKNK